MKPVKRKWILKSCKGPTSELKTAIEAQNAMAPSNAANFWAKYESIHRSIGTALL